MKKINEYEDGQILLVKIKSLDAFSSVFGADCFLRNFPRIQTIGILVRKMKFYSSLDRSFWYVLENGKPVDSTSFFSDEEMTRSMEVVYDGPF